MLILSDKDRSRTYALELETWSIPIPVRANYYVFTQASGEKKGALEQRMTLPFSTVYRTLKLSSFWNGYQTRRSHLQALAVTVYLRSYKAI